MKEIKTSIFIGYLQHVDLVDRALLAFIGNFLPHMRATRVILVCDAMYFIIIYYYYTLFLVLILFYEHFSSFLRSCANRIDRMPMTINQIINNKLSYILYFNDRQIQ